MGEGGFWVGVETGWSAYDRVTSSVCIISLPPC